MDRNSFTSPLLRLPPELRGLIYGLVLGGQQVWIAHSESIVEWRTTSERRARLLGGAETGQQSGQYYHRWGKFYHSTAEPFDIVNPFRSALHLGLLSVCRQIYTETALLPYALNAFTFRDDSVRRLFEQSARRGKKRVQKKAIGKYEIGTWPEFRSRHIPLGKK